ncbi:hypothetical protein [Arthrobacter sp. D5-1]|uniref:hypothetical protein n=1 Tax=Arthrobacter sp. D5-1 TaxID=1477518 RepID=UPI001A99786D|nr:hypothetical protein [Arthrobacter sp. D5-1]QSZ49414.1 hypothetical protein AYX22_14075 [Arthrobacter sp. D5-1]
MLDELYVVVDGLEFHGRPGLGPFTITKDGLDGWTDSVPLRGEKLAWPQGHGSLVLPRYQESRSVTITGAILGKNLADREIQMNTLSGLLAYGQLGRVQVTKGGLTQWTDASRDSLSIDEIRGSNNAVFQLQLWCPDPRKFGEPRGPFVASVGSNALNVHHKGNAGATAVFEVAGNMPGGYILTIKGQVFTVTQPLIPGQPHTVDYGDGRVRINGAVIHGGIGYGFTPLVTPGLPTAVSIAPRPPFAGTATATLTLFDTYI